MQDDDRKGTSSQPIPHAPLGAMAKPTQPFKVPKNTDAEPALSTTTDPYDYESGSGKTYHNKHPEKKETETKKPTITAGMNESTETAGTTTLWKTNAGDSPPEAVKVKDEDSTTSTEEVKPKKKKTEEEPKEKEEKKEKKEEKEEPKEEKAEAKEEKPKKEESSEEKAESASFAQRFGLKPSAPSINSFL